MRQTDPVLLLIEDDPADARLIQRAIEKVDIPAKVVHLTDGDKAVSYLAGEGEYGNREQYPLPWLMLVDVKLPKRSGIEVLQWVRAQEGFISSTPVVMFSSSSHGVDINAAYHYGANSYLVKPESSHQLQSMLSVVKSYWFLVSQFPHHPDDKGKSVGNRAP
jgi:CheY-like chemotaxis protein